MRLQNTKLRVIEVSDNKFEATVMAVARNKATKLTTLYKRGDLNWTILQEELSIKLDESVLALKLDYLMLDNLLIQWVRQAPERARIEQVRLAEELAAASKRTYTAVDIKLPNNLAFKTQQKKAIGALLEVLYSNDQRGALVPLGTGKGKSWIAAGIAKWLQDNKPAEFLNFMGLIPNILIITKRSVVLEFKETLKMLGLKDIGLSIDVWSYNEMSSKKNQIFFKTEIISLYGSATKVIKFALPYTCAPKLIIMDECQETKKEKSKRTKYLAAFRDCVDTKFIFTSATPAVTLMDTMFMSLSMGLTHNNRPLDRESFPEFVAMIGDGSDPRKPNAAALQRWSMRLGDRFIRPPNDPQPVHAINRVKLFEIIDPINRSMMDNAMKNYKESLEKVGRSIDPRGEVMVAFMVMARATELATVDTWVEDAIEAHKNGFAPVLAIRFTETLKEFVLKLTESEYFRSIGASRDKISLIWGGNTEIQPHQLLSEQRNIEVATAYGNWVITNPDITSKASASDLGISEEDYRAFKKGIKYTSERIFREMSKETFAARNEKLRSMKLHGQTQDERYLNVRKFLDGVTEFCVYTLSSGGTGISLDHRYQHCRPRKVMSTMTYWAEEFAQALGRCVRVSTISDTEQSIYVPDNTLLSDHMAPRLAQKLKSVDAIGSSNVDLAAELERAMKKRSVAQKLTVEDKAGYKSSGVIETEEEDDDDEDAATETE